MTQHEDDIEKPEMWEGLEVFSHKGKTYVPFEQVYKKLRISRQALTKKLNTLQRTGERDIPRYLLPGGSGQMMTREDADYLLTPQLVNHDTDDE